MIRKVWVLVLVFIVTGTSGLLAREVTVLAGTNQGGPALCSGRSGPVYLKNYSIPMDQYFKHMATGNFVRNGKWLAIAVKGGRQRKVWEGYPKAFSQNKTIHIGQVNAGECLVIHSLSPFSNVNWQYKVVFP